MPANDYGLITCPQCNRSLPPKAVNCQFCGTSLANVVRPQAPVTKTKYRKSVEPWVMTLFYLVAGYWLLEGLFFIVMGVVAFLAPVDPALASVTQVAGVFSMGIGGLIALIGVGLFMKWEWARGIVNVFCWIRILGGLWRLKDLIFAGLFMSAGMLILNFFFTVVGIVAAGMQVWLLSETD